MNTDIRDGQVLTLYNGNSAEGDLPQRCDLHDAINSLKAAPSIQTIENLRFLDLQQAPDAQSPSYSVKVCDEFRMNFTIESSPDGKDIAVVTGLERTPVAATPKRK